MSVADGANWSADLPSNEGGARSNASSSSTEANVPVRKCSGSRQMCLDGLDGRMGVRVGDDGVEEGRAVGTDGLRVATQDPIKKDGKMADLLLRRARGTPTGKKGGGAKWIYHRRSRSHFLRGCCPSVLNEVLLVAPQRGCGKGSDPPLTSVPLCGQLPPGTHTHTHFHFHPLKRSSWNFGFPGRPLTRN